MHLQHNWCCTFTTSVETQKMSIDFSLKGAENQLNLNFIVAFETPGEN